MGIEHAIFRGMIFIDWNGANTASNEHRDEITRYVNVLITSWTGDLPHKDMREYVRLNVYENLGRLSGLEMERMKAAYKMDMIGLIHCASFRQYYVNGYEKIMGDLAYEHLQAMNKAVEKKYAIEPRVWFAIRAENMGESNVFEFGGMKSLRLGPLGDQAQPTLSLGDLAQPTLSNFENVAAIVKAQIDNLGNERSFMGGEHDPE